MKPNGKISPALVYFYKFQTLFIIQCREDMEGTKLEDVDTDD